MSKLLLGSTIRATIMLAAAVIVPAAASAAEPIQRGNLLPAPFLDISAGPTAVLNAGYDERGLLGLAFHPGYENNGRFFARYSASISSICH